MDFWKSRGRGRSYDCRSRVFPGVYISSPSSKISWCVWSMVWERPATVGIWKVVCCLLEKWGTWSLSRWLLENKWSEVEGMLVVREFFQDYISALCVWQALIVQLTLIFGTKARCRLWCLGRNRFELPGGETWWHYGISFWREVEDIVEVEMFVVWRPAKNVKCLPDKSSWANSLRISNGGEMQGIMYCSRGFRTVARTNMIWI
jgi:hypothetical protein